jgi:hypothetical protein
LLNPHRNSQHYCLRGGNEAAIVGRYDRPVGSCRDLGSHDGFREELNPSYELIGLLKRNRSFAGQVQDHF